LMISCRRGGSLQARTEARKMNKSSC
jgi:hypothetical protein